jgi:hypothetical protein
MSSTRQKRPSEVTRAEIDERRRALERSFQTASDFTDENGRLVTRIRVDLSSAFARSAGVSRWRQTIAPR